jgi:hypothetical protein
MNHPQSLIDAFILDRSLVKITLVLTNLVITMYDQNT